jgi:hypothetical protein
MHLVLSGIAAGVLGTLVMDAANFLLARVGILTKIDVRTIGRVSTGWVRGRVRYEHPSEIPQVSSALTRGYIAHYLIGMILAIAYLIGWELLIGGPPSAMWAFVYGVTTTAAAYLLLLPSIGLGICGRLSPDGIRLPLSSLVNHIFYGLGIAAGVALL